MIDLTAIDQKTLLARGEYSTLNSEQKRLMKKLIEVCSSLTSVGPQVMAYMQPRGGGTVETGAALGLTSYVRDVADKIEDLIIEIDEVESFKASIKPDAWG